MDEHRPDKMRVEASMARNILRTGKKSRPKTTVKGKRYRCAICRKRSPKPVKTPAPWYCPACLSETARRTSDEFSQGEEEA